MPRLRGKHLLRHFFFFFFTLARIFWDTARDACTLRVLQELTAPRPPYSGGLPYHSHSRTWRRIHYYASCTGPVPLLYNVQARGCIMRLDNLGMAHGDMAGWTHRQPRTRLLVSRTSRGFYNRTSRARCTSAASSPHGAGGKPCHCCMQAKLTRPACLPSPWDLLEEVPWFLLSFAWHAFPQVLFCKPCRCFVPDPLPGFLDSPDARMPPFVLLTGQHFLFACAAYGKHHGTLTTQHFVALVLSSL